MLTDLLKSLHEHRARAVERLGQIDAAIKALGGSIAPVKKKRSWKMSAAARKKISLAQKARWAKAKK